MSQPDTAISRHGDIIIVRRAHQEEEGSHGGVWKIAFADFMTALMAFFLVMWLVNASDDATKKQVAQYFNPIKLNATAPPVPGLDSGATSAPAQPAAPPSGPTNAPGETAGKPVGGSETGGEDQAIFRDPYAVLAEIVAQSGAGVQNGRSEPSLDGTGLPGLNGGDAYRDPFDPETWQLEPNLPDPQPVAESTRFATLVEENPVPQPAVQQAAPAPAPAAAPSEPAPAPAVGQAEVDAMEAELRSAAGDRDGASETIDVTQSDEGIVISLADSLQSGMFEIGSARPSAETIHLVETVAALLKEKPGTIVIRGHTDARPYTGGEYDNWRLSSARAQMAYHMLLRGGLDETRVESIEGFADRRLRDPQNPNGAENRRIEILLREKRA